MKNTDRPLDWGNIAFLTISPLLAVIFGSYYVSHFGIRPFDIALFVGMFFATGLSITGGYHRHFAHISYKAHPAVRLFYLVFGACALENSALHWAADHRMHHRFVDTDKDPYNAGQGFWFSHIGWIFKKSSSVRDFTIVGDLLRDRWVRWQHRYHVHIAILVGFGLPLAIGLAVGHPVAALLWGGLIRVVFVHHATFFINSLAHMSGTQPYSKTDTSRDSWWLAFLTNGEGYHNFHHRFPSDYRNGIRWYQWDPTKWLIAGLNVAGMTHKLHRVPAQLILRARMEVEAANAERHLERLPIEVVGTVRIRMESARERFENALVQWADMKVKYRDWKQAAIKDSSAVRSQWKVKMKEYEVRLDEAKNQWREFMQAIPRISPTQTI